MCLLATQKEFVPVYHFYYELRCGNVFSFFLVSTLLQHYLQRENPYEIRTHGATIHMGFGDIWCNTILPLLHAGYPAGQEITARVSVEVPQSEILPVLAQRKPR